MDLKKCVRSIVDWPIKGVIFRDLTTLMKDPLALKESCDILYERYRDQHIDKIVGIDARGFVFGAVLAYKLGLGFVPVRKKGKLPHDTIEEIYSLEYGAGVMEIHSDAISHGEKVVIVDDLIATGGTALASAELLRKAGAVISHALFVIDLPDLGGADRLRAAGITVSALMEFDGD